MKKSLSVNNICNADNINCIPKTIYSAKEIFDMIDNYRHLYCPVCKKKNDSKVHYMALDMIFCSDFCRKIVCNKISFKEINNRRYFIK